MKDVNEIKNYSIENIKASHNTGAGFDFFRFEYFIEDIPHLKKSHRHEFYAFIIVTNGKGSHTIDFEEYEIISNRVFFINYGQIHAYNTIEQVKGFVVLFTEEFYNNVFTGNEKIKSDTALNNFETFKDIPKEEIEDWVNLLMMIEKEHAIKSASSDHVLCLYLKILVLKYAELNRAFAPQSDKLNRKQELVSTYVALINANYITKKTPAQFAPDLNITANYLNALCKEITGKSAGLLIKIRVILEAKRLLTHTDKTVSQIAYFLNFEDKSHFGKYFKNHVGKTPESFRKNFISNT
jgi:AraC family transcriptional activator of pobA